MKRKIKALLFDMDGVLVDAKMWHFEAFNRALELFGIKLTLSEHKVKYDGLPTKKKLEILSEDCYLPRELHEFINKLKQQYTMDIINIHCKPNFDQEYALSFFRQKEYKLAVCSNSIRKTVEIMLGKAELLHYFDYVVSNEDVINVKPDPEMYLKAIRHFKLKPKECVIIEDNEHGIAAARASGAYVMEVEGLGQVNKDDILSFISSVEN